MPAVCFYFQVHQPYRLRKYRVFDIGERHEYWDETGESDRNNERILRKVAAKCYLPVNKLWLKLLTQHPELRLTFSFTGTLLEQLEAFAPDALVSFQALVATGRVELLAETYYHSLASLYSIEEFRAQVTLHGGLIERLFGVKPVVFRNTELIWSDKLAPLVTEMGYKGVLAEGADDILGSSSPNFLYQAPKTKMKLLLKNYRLSDDIAFRFGEKSWKEWPLSAEKFALWVEAQRGEVVNLFMDYETFGEHQWQATGIFEFLEALPEALLRERELSFVTASEALACFPSRGTLSFPRVVSWADIERDTSAWRGNAIQDDALGKLYAMRERVLASADDMLIRDWRRLTTSDHFYYMCTKWFADGDVHKYFNPHESPYDAYISFVNVLADLQTRLDPVRSSAPDRPKTRSSTSDVVKNGSLVGRKFLPMQKLSF